MSDVSTNISNYKNDIATAIGAIPFSNSTVASLGIITLYQASSSSFPNTAINIYLNRIRSKYKESKLNDRSYEIVIRVWINAVNREAQAQSDLEYLTEQIVNKLENLLRTPEWADGYLDNDTLEAASKEYIQNYYYKTIPVWIHKFVSVNN